MRRAREAQFPQSVAEYHAMGSRAAQLRVARFLMADASKQDQMSTQSNWAWRQTEPLIKVYYSNVSLLLLRLRLFVLALADCAVLLD